MPVWNCYLWVVLLSEQQLEYRLLNKAVEASPLSPKLSTQVQGETVNIYADSQYAFGACHATGQLWQLCGFMTSSGSKISNASSITEQLKLDNCQRNVLSFISQSIWQKDEKEIGNGLTYIAQQTPGLQAVQLSELALLAPEKLCLIAPAEENGLLQKVQTVRCPGNIENRHGKPSNFT